MSITQQNQQQLASLIQTQASVCGFCYTEKRLNAVVRPWMGLDSPRALCRSCAIARGMIQHEPQLVAWATRYLAQPPIMDIFPYTPVSRRIIAARLLAEQNGCAMCTKPTTNLSLNHDHKTGAIRGILCGRCNSLLGHIDYSVELLRTIEHFIERNPM